MAKKRVHAASGIQIQREGSFVELTHRWFHPILGPFWVVTAVGWGGFSWLIFRQPWIAYLQRGEFHADLLMPHPWIAIAFAYTALAQLLNRTRIRVDRERLLVRVGPLPWFGGREIPVSEIRSIALREYRSSRQKRSVAVKVETRLASGKWVPLIRGIRKRDQALLIEQSLESFLNLKDRLGEDRFLPRDPD